MRLFARVGTTLSATVLAAGTLTTVGAGVAQATHGHCGYPPHRCGISFDQSSYFPRELVNFRTDKAFKRGETVTGHVHCRHHKNWSIGPYTANQHHRVIGSFRVHRHTPRGECNVRLVGETSGWDAVGSFFVKHHRHRAAAGAAGESSAGGSIQNSALTPAVTSNGTHVLGTSFTAGGATAATAPTAPSGGSSLPFSGSAYTVPMTALGSALLVLGGALLFLVRRRRAANGVA